MDNINDSLASFQNGVDTIVNGCTTYGSTPASNTPTGIVNSIKTIYTNRYNTGYNAGKTSDKKIVYCGNICFVARQTSTYNISNQIINAGFTLAGVTINDFFLKPSTMSGYGLNSYEGDSGFSWTFTYSNGVITTNGGDPSWVVLNQYFNLYLIK